MQWPGAAVRHCDLESMGDAPFDHARARIERFANDNPGWVLRLYRTPKGFRVLVMHRTKDRRGNWVTEEYSRGTLDPTTDTYGPPTKISWLGDVCKGR